MSRRVCRISAPAVQQNAAGFARRPPPPARARQPPRPAEPCPPRPGSTSTNPGEDLGPLISHSGNITACYAATAVGTDLRHSHHHPFQTKQSSDDAYRLAAIWWLAAGATVKSTPYSYCRHPCRTEASASRIWFSIAGSPPICASVSRSCCNWAMSHALVVVAASGRSLWGRRGGLLLVRLFAGFGGRFATAPTSALFTLHTAAWSRLTNTSTPPTGALSTLCTTASRLAASSALSALERARLEWLRFGLDAVSWAIVYPASVGIALVIVPRLDVGKSLANCRGANPVFSGYVSKLVTSSLLVGPYGPSSG